MQIHTSLLLFLLASLNSRLVQSSAAASSISQKKTCAICLSKKKYSSFTTLKCKHSYCSACLKQLIDTSLNYKSCNNIKCPDCTKTLEYEEIKSISGNKKGQCDLFCQTALYDWLKAHPHAKHCPTPDCPYAFLNDSKLFQKVSCPQCQQRYCGNCLINHEQNTSCAQAQEFKQIDRPTASLIQATTKPCPKCSTRISRIDGCDHMTCTRCRWEFCWHCNAPYKNANGTHHPSYCSLRQRTQYVQNPRIIAQEAPELHAQPDEIQDNRITICSKLCKIVCLCYGTSCMCAMAYMLYNRSDSEQYSERYIANYVPRFKGIERPYYLANKYCPMYDMFPNRKWFDQKKCDSLSDLGKQADKHHNQMIKDLRDSLSMSSDEVNYAMVASFKRHEHNIDLINQARKKCGCIDEPKKTK